MTLLQSRNLVVVEDLGEDSSGHAQPRETNVRGTFVDVMEGSSLAVHGGIPAGSVFAYIEPDGYGVTWGTDDAEIRTISDGVRTMRVSKVLPATNPRTGVLHHIEASGGV